MKIPYIAVGNDELGDNLGWSTMCHMCGKKHRVAGLKLKLQTVKCGKLHYLVGIDGKDISTRHEHSELVKLT